MTPIRKPRKKSANIKTTERHKKEERSMDIPKSAPKSDKNISVDRLRAVSDKAINICASQISLFADKKYTINTSRKSNKPKL